MTAILRLANKAYGVAIKQEIEERIGTAVAVGALYTTLNRLETKGYVSSRRGDPVPEKGGRAKRYFQIQDLGQSALDESERVRKRMKEGLLVGQDVALLERGQGSFETRPGQDEKQQRADGDDPERETGRSVPADHSLEGPVRQMVERGLLYDEAVNEFAKKFIKRVLDRSRGNQSRAARLLGIHRKTLSRKIELYKIKPRRFIRPKS